MNNIINTMTGAATKLVSRGTNIKVMISGTASQVAHAVTLLYNYHALGAIPEWYDDEAQAAYNYMELLVNKRSFMRGMLALVYTQETTRNGWHDLRGRCSRAVFKCAHELRMLLDDRHALDTLKEDDGSFELHTATA